MNQIIERLIPNELYKRKYSKFDILGLSIELTNKQEFKKAFNLRKLAEKMDINDTINNGYQDHTFYLLEEAIVNYISYHKYKYSQEYVLYEPIKHYINKLIQNAEVVEHPILNKKKPDLFLKVNNELCVGEIKPRNFTNIHIKQLKIYMETYNTKIGYAFGLKLTGKLYDNMIFININNIKEKYYEINPN